MSSENTVARSSDPAHPAFDVIALVTSADEREILDRILGALPVGFAASVISAQHEAESDDPLSYQTALPLQWAAPDMPLKHGHIIVCSLRDAPTVKAEGLLTIQPDVIDKFSHPIDRFMESLARSYGERALAVVLADTQTDGENGIAALKAAGGTVIAQSADSQTATATGAVDLQFPVRDIGAVLTNIVTQRRVTPKFAPMAVVPGSSYAEQILENIDMFYVLDKNFCLTYLNRKAEEAWGRRREDFIGKHLWTEFPAVVGSESYQMHLQAMDNRQPVQYETISPILHRWVDVKIFPTAEGGLAVYFYDIDERKRRELNAALLIEIDNDLAYLSDVGEIMDAISEKIVSHFGLARLVYSRINLATDEAESFYEKHDPDTISGLRTFHLSDILSKEGVGELAAGQLIAIDDAQTDPRTAAFAHVYRSYHAQSQIRAPHLIKGDLRFMLSAHHREPHRWRIDELELMREVTARIYLWLERTNAERALRESEERYRTLFESIDEGFCIIEMLFDADDKPVDYIFVETNPAFVGQTGLVSAEGKRARELVPLLESHWFETYGRVARTGAPERFVNGSEAMGRWFDTYAFPYGDGQVGILFNDITQRKQADEALRASEQRFRRTLEIETVGIIFFRPDGAITGANDAFLNMGGYTRDDFESGRLRWDELTPAEWMPASLRAVEEFRTIGRTTPYEKEYYRKDGSRWWALFAAQRLTDNEGIEFVIDIDKRKQVELTLRDTEERVRLILDSAKDYSIYAVDTEGNFISWNTGAERIFGYSEAEVLGQHQRLIYTPEDRAAGIPEREMQKALTQGYSDNERWHVCNDGRLIYGSGMVRPLRDADGTLKGFTKVMRDETDRKLAEARMQMLQQLAADLSGRLTVQDMGKGILETCRKSVAATKASLFLMTADGQSLEHFSDLSSDPVQEHYMHIPLALSMPLTDAARANQIVWGSTQDDYIQQYPHLRDDILLNNVHGFIALPLVFEQNILGSIAIAFSQPKALSREEHEFLVAVAHLCAQALERARLYEIEREAREAAEKANQLKMQFLGMISHELRTPLASIKGYTSTLLATDVTFTPEEQREFLGVVDEETDKLTDLVVQLLDLTRLQAGSLRIDLSAESLDDIVEIAQTQLWTLTLQHQFVMSLPGDLPPVLADRQRIAQVFVNLVGNAAKFAPQGSSITINALHDSDFIRIDVSDEGPGIPLGQRTEVFEAFRQFERLTTSHDPGAGLGLAICKGIVEAHGGQIWVQDRDTGTTISFTLRVAKEEA